MLKIRIYQFRKCYKNAAYYSSVFSSTNNNLVVCSKHKKWNALLNGIENIKCQNLYDSFQENQFKCYLKNTINIIYCYKELDCIAYTPL